MKHLLQLLAIFLLIISCKDDAKTTETTAKNVHKIVAEEVLHVSEYSYIKFTKDNKENWVAVPSTPIQTGKTYYYGTAIEMKNFESKDLNRTFETVYFAQRISVNEEGAIEGSKVNPHGEGMHNAPAANNAHATPKKNTSSPKKEIKVTKAANGIDIATLLKNKASYANKTVIIKAEVVKYSPSIMNSNWFHIQDGSNFDGEFDLTVTTKEVVKVGDVITLKATVTLDKDFGAGYFYKVILENATLTK
ncbi:MAG: hypothetical protein JKY08_12305 [Flavobacteriaceae bacterium]|nr:hypothetical protein [Flavobacteriaceae bacterium]